MSVRHGLRELLDEATAEVPQRYRSAPLAGIQRRVARRRATRAVTVGLVVLAALVAGAGAVRAAAGGGENHPATASSPTGPQLPGLAWLSAMVARDNRSVTVYAGVAGCRGLAGPRAVLTGWTSRTVTIGVYARVVDAADCSTAAHVVPMVVHLPAALGHRTLRDAAGGTHPTYHRRDLPDLAANGWRRVPTSWEAPSGNWYGGVNGPDGSTITLAAEPTANHTDLGQRVGTRRLGPHTATITGGGRRDWQASWRVGTTTYTLRYVPSEGQRFTLAEFTELLDSLHWS